MFEYPNLLHYYLAHQNLKKGRKKIFRGINDREYNRCWVLYATAGSSYQRKHQVMLKGCLAAERRCRHYRQNICNRDHGTKGCFQHVLWAARLHNVSHLMGKEKGMHWDGRKITAQGTQGKRKDHVSQLINVIMCVFSWYMQVSDFCRFLSDSF